MTHDKQCREACVQLRNKKCLAYWDDEEGLLQLVSSIIARCTRPEGLIGATEVLMEFDKDPTDICCLIRGLRTLRTALADYPEPEEEPHEPA